MKTNTDEEGEKKKEYIIKGSTDEDDPSSRALNHFYDPIRNIGIDNKVIRNIKLFLVV